MLIFLYYFARVRYKLVSCPTKLSHFNFLRTEIYSRIALFHRYTLAKLYCPGVTGFAKLERWGSLIAKDTALPEAAVKKLASPLL